MNIKLLAFSGSISLAMLLSACGEVKPAQSNTLNLANSHTSTLVEQDDVFKIAYVRDDNTAVLDAYDANNQLLWRKEAPLSSDATTTRLTLLSGNVAMSSTGTGSNTQFALIHFDTGNITALDAPAEFSQVAVTSSQTDNFRAATSNQYFIYANLQGEDGNALQERAAAFSISNDGTFRTEWISTEYYYRPIFIYDNFFRPDTVDHNDRSTGILAAEVLPRGTGDLPPGSERTYLLSDGKHILATLNSNRPVIKGEINGIWVEKNDNLHVARLNLDGSETPPISCYSAHLDITVDGQQSALSCRTGSYHSDEGTTVHLLNQEGFVTKTTFVSEKYGDAHIYRAVNLQDDGRVILTTERNTRTHSYGTSPDGSSPNASQSLSLYVTKTSTLYHHVLAFDGKPAKVLQEPVYSNTIIENPMTEEWEDVSSIAGPCRPDGLHMFTNGNVLTNSTICTNSTERQSGLYFFDL